MNRPFIIGFLMLAGILNTPVSQAQQYVSDYNVFYSPENGPFIELYTTVLGNSLIHGVPVDSVYQDEVQVTYILKQDEEIVNFKKTLVKGEPTDGSYFPDVMDQQRLSIPPGEYQLEIEVIDMKSSAMIPYSTYADVSVKAPKDKVFISGIQLADRIVRAEETTELTKSGYNIIPLVSHFYPPDFNRLAYYYEIYNTDKVINDRFLIKQYIKDRKTGDILPQFTRMSKESSKEVVVQLNAFPIDQLPTGFYDFVVEIRNRDNELMATQSTSFDRSNPMANINPEDIAQMDIDGTFAKEIQEDSLDYWIASLRPLTSDKEKRVIDKTIEDKNLEFKRKFFYTFWQNRNSKEPGRAWETYRQEIYKTNKLFGTMIKEGFETDRGRVYLKYGAPNSITDRPNEPSTYPYQIWHYYKIGAFNNRRFIFYQPDLVTNDYELLHSDLRGERQNYRWKAMLNSRNTPMGDIDSKTEGSFNHWGGNSSEFYTLPR